MSLVYEEMQVEWNGEMARIAKKDFNPEIHKPWVAQTEEAILAEAARLADEKPKGKHK